MTKKEMDCVEAFTDGMLAVTLLGGDHDQRKARRVTEPYRFGLFFLGHLLILPHLARHSSPPLPPSL